MRHFFLFLSLVLSTQWVAAQTNIYVGAPANTGATSALRAPNGTSTHTTLRAHLIIPASELAGIPAGTTFSGIGFLLNSGCNVATAGNIQILLENTSDVTNTKSTTWSTAISTMTTVYSGPYNLPTTSGPVDLASTGTFTYTGGGLYVAYDYTATTTATTGAVYLCNNSLSGGVKVGSSSTSTPPTTLSASSSFRPEIRFRFTNPYTNNMELNALYTDQGSPCHLFGNTQKVYARVKNASSTTLTNVPLNLLLQGPANTNSYTHTISSIAAGQDSLIEFPSVAIPSSGIQNMRLYLPLDQSPVGDTIDLEYSISCDVVGEKYGDSVYSGLGYNTGTGILANRLVLPSGTPAYIKKVMPVISDNSNSVGNQIVGVLLDASGTIIDSTAAYTIATADLQNPVSLTFIGGNVNHAGDTVYYGFRQLPNSTTGYFPCATQNPVKQVPDSVFCGFDANGGGYANYTQFGVFMIEAMVSPISDNFMLESSPSSPVCIGTSVNLTANSGFSNYEFYIDGNSVQNGSSDSYTFTPISDFSAKVMATLNSCIWEDSLQMVVDSSVSFTLNENLCPGQSYNFNGTNLSAPGTYLDTLVASTGCDSVVTLELTQTSIDTSVSTLTTQELEANEAGATYEWIDCATELATGQTGKVLTFIVPDGYYRVAVTVGSCTDTSGCHYLEDPNSVIAPELARSAAVYPVPADRELHIESHIAPIIGLRLVDVQGRIVLEEKISAMNKYSIQLPELLPGNYILQIQTETALIPKRVRIQ